MRRMVTIEILELIVIGAIAIELYSLYNHSKLENRIDGHILEANEALANSNEMIKKLDEHMLRYDEHINMIDEHTKGVDEHMIRFDEHLAETNIHLNDFHELMMKLDDHMHALLNEYLKDYTHQPRTRPSFER